MDLMAHVYTFGIPTNPGCNRHILFDHVFRVPGEGWSLGQCALGDLMKIIQIRGLHIL